MIDRVLQAGFVACTAMLFACAEPVPEDRMSETEAAAEMADPDDPCDPANLAAEALASGTKIFAGVTLEASTPITAILGNADTYVGQVVRAEGVIVEICSSQGCYVTLQDEAGNHLNLKVIDGELDFRELVKTGQYAIGEGVFSKVGEHGAQLDIMGHGALVGATVCPF